MRNNFTKIITCLMFFCAGIVFGQSKSISGIITDAEGLPLPGVNILIKGTTTGTQSDFDGNYSINAKINDVLVFSYVGMAQQEITVGSSNEVNVTMGAGTDLDEVVVVAYGSQTKKSLVGSVTSLDSNTLGKQQLTSVTNAIQGTVAGVSVVNSGGQPGSNPTIRIRGISSINASAGPLYVVDGVPFNGNLNSISADQIESMNVLKDASSTALYGSRGANGVILITTKNGAYNSKTTISLSAVTGMSSQGVENHQVVRASDYMRYFWEAKRNTNLYVDGQSPAEAGQNAANTLISDLGYNPFNVDQPIDANGNVVTGANLLWDTDWEKALLRQNALRQEYTLSVNGGGKNSKYFLSANYLDQEGPVRNSDFKRVTTRLNIESKVTDWLTVGLRSSLSTSTQHDPLQAGSGFNSPLGWVYGVASVYPIYRRDPGGALIYNDLGNLSYDYGNNGDVLNGSRSLRPNYNAVGTLFDDENTDKNTNVIANGFADLKLTDFLSFKTTISYENFLSDGYNYTNLYGGSGLNTQGGISQNRNITTTLNINNNFNFKKSFGDHTINANAIFETYQYKFDGLNAYGTGFLPGVKVLNGATVPASIGGFINEERLTSYLGRVGYNYKKKYFIEGSYRRDGSTKFSKDTRFGDFYSIGGSWIVSDEAFFNDSNTFSLLKLRASYGELGNNSGFGLFPYRQGYNTGVNELDNTGVILGGATDPLLTWETTAITDLGIDFGLFKNRIEGTLGYFNKESIDLIYDKPLPGSTGNLSITTNIGSLRNYGIEVSLNGRIIQKQNLSWSVGLNLSTLTNEITELTQESVITGNKRYEVGRSIYDFYIEDWAGVDPDDGYGMWYSDVLDADGNPTGERETTKDYAQASRYYKGSALPDIQGGFNTDLQIGNFDFNALFSYSLGGKVYDSSYQSLSAGFQAIGVPDGTFMEGRWQQPGDMTDIPLFLASSNNFNSRSSRFLFDNDYIRMRAVTLAYNLPSNLTESLTLGNVRFYLRGDNLFTWQSHKGIDPEQGFGGNTDNRSSQLKTISLGVNVQF